MKNEIVLRGILKNIRPSHFIGDVEYDTADLITKCYNNKDSVVSLVFKKFSNTHENDEYVSLVGNVRSYSHTENDKNKVRIYVFTYFDEPETNEGSITNHFVIEGRICKINQELRHYKNGKCNLQFILANNIFASNSKLNSFLPCICWGKIAHTASTLNINDCVRISGELRSREYTRTDKDGNISLNIAHELVVETIDKLDGLSTNAN